MRRLKSEDRAGMAEWMGDKEITLYFNEDFSGYTLEKIEAFIENSFGETNQHFAIVNECDEYLGTVSLKNIDMKHKHAEYAIVMRRSALHTGAAKAGTLELLNYGFHTLKLRRIYLNVLEKNQRAVRFYNRFGFTREGVFRKHIYKNGEWLDLVWYSMLVEEFLHMDKQVYHGRKDNGNEV